MADLIPSSLHVPLPYVMGYDMFPMTSLIEKENYLEVALKDEHILFFEHDPFSECCTIEKTEKGYKRKDCFNLDVLTD